jgi:predicted DNA-binding ribbon-helix-helix protein
MCFSKQYRIVKRDRSETSTTSEPQVLQALRYLAFEQGITVREVLRRIDATPRPHEQNFASAIRCHVIRSLMRLVLDLSAPHHRRSRKLNDGASAARRGRHSKQPSPAKPTIKVG